MSTIMLSALIFFKLTPMCQNIIKHSFNENIKELIRLFVNFILTRKIEIFYIFFTLRIFHTPYFRHSSFSTLRTPRFPLNRTSQTKRVSNSGAMCECDQNEDTFSVYFDELEHYFIENGQKEHT